jgi:UDP-N-acetylglucosamine diphosphorylase/glucosamine-1-phosphate N-acetyltransferase
MRLILFEGAPEKRVNFHPLALSRPIWDLRCGMTTLGEKLIAKLAPAQTAGFVEPYLADAYAERAGFPVNDVAALEGDDLLLVNARVKAGSFTVPAKGSAEVGLAGDGEVLYARIPAAQADKLPGDTFAAFLASARQTLPTVACALPTYNYIWDLMLDNSRQLIDDFRAAGRSGVEGKIEQPVAIRGNGRDVYVAPTASIHPMVVIDAENGPVYIDEGAVIHPFTRIEGPCYIGQGTILLGAKCRMGNSIGPMCRVGGEVEDSIIHGWSNKYHDGFLGHAYVGEWVNLGAMTTNSDLKNDYSDVALTLDGKALIPTGSTKVGAMIGDHAKTSIGTLFNTGAYVGAMTLLVARGKPLPKFIPSFCWYIDGLSEGRGREGMFHVAQAAKRRRGQTWTAAEERMWVAVHALTANQRADAIARSQAKETR